MTRIVRPDVRFHSSWAETTASLEGESDGSGDWHRRAEDQGDLSVPALARWVEELLAERTAPGSGRVPSEYYWITDAADDSSDDGEVIGFLALRTELNDFLLRTGGHVGYSIRPDRRRRGHASRALALGVRRAADLGIDRVLVTCDEDNLGSARTIEANAGVLENVQDGKRRYWIDAAKPRA